MSSIPINFFLEVIAITLNSEISLLIMSKVALIINAEASNGTIFRNGSGVWTGHSDGKNGILNNINILECSGNGIFGGEGEVAVGAGAEDQNLFVALVTAEIEVFLFSVG